MKEVIDPLMNEAKDEEKMEHARRVGLSGYTEGAEVNHIDYNSGSGSGFGGEVR